MKVAYAPSDRRKKDLPVKTLRALAIAAGALAGVMIASVSTVAGPLDAYRWERRVLLVFTPGPKHPEFIAQRREAERHNAGFAARDLTVVEVIAQEISPGGSQDAAGEAESLRSRFEVAEEDFQVVLVGKDGGEKLRTRRKMDTNLLFTTIDAMPMRQREMHQRR